MEEEVTTEPQGLVFLLLHWTGMDISGGSVSEYSVE